MANLEAQYPDMRRSVRTAPLKISVLLGSPANLGTRSAPSTCASLPSAVTASKSTHYSPQATDDESAATTTLTPIEEADGDQPPQTDGGDWSTDEEFTVLPVTPSGALQPTAYRHALTGKQPRNMGGGLLAHPSRSVPRSISDVYVQTP